MRIAWFTPFNPHSAIGHYSEAIVEELVKTDEVVVYASDAPGDGHVGSARVVALPTTAAATAVLRELKAFDVAVYNMGNHMPYHKRIYEVLLQPSGRGGSARSGPARLLLRLFPEGKAGADDPGPADGLRRGAGSRGDGSQPSSTGGTSRRSTTRSASASRCSGPPCTAAKVSLSIRNTAAGAWPPSSRPRWRSSTSRCSARPRHATEERRVG